MKTKKKLFPFLLLLFLVNSVETKEEKIKKTDIFPTLTKITEYAKTNPEYPGIDNDNWLKPNYKSFYQKNLPSRIGNLLRFIRIKSQSPWSAKQFKDILENVTKYRENIAHMGKFVKKIIPKSDSSFFLFGDLFGAFHSFSRNLSELKRLRIIDENLKILNKNHYIVFNGNVIDLSPYILETLTVVLRLMENNPENVIYIRGYHESKEYWLNYGLRDELEIKAKHLSDEPVPLKKIVDRFFNTLPLALYIVSEEKDKINALRISPKNRDDKELNEVNFTELFEKGKDKIKIFNLRNAKPKNKPNVNIKTIIKSSYEKKPNIPPTGLTTTSPDKGATSFILFSSPTKTYRSMYKFFYDTFTRIDTYKNFNNWTITLHNQDVREKIGFNSTTKYNIASGDKITEKYKENIQLKKKIASLKSKLKKYDQKIKKPPKVDIPVKEKKIEPKSRETGKEEITIGTTVDLTGPLTMIGENVKQGIYTGINLINTKNKIKDKKIKTIILDDKSNPQTIKNNIKKLIEQYQTTILISPLIISDTKEYLKTKNTLIMFPIPPYSFKEKQKGNNIVNFGPTYEEIEKFSFQYAKEKIKAEKFAFFYQKGLTGSSLPDLLKNIKKDKVLKIEYTPRTISFKDKAEKIKKLSPDVLFIWGLPTSATKLITEIEPIILTNTIIIGHKLGTKEFRNFIKEKNLQYIGIEDIPNPYKSNIEIMKEYRENIEQKNINLFSAQGYINSRILADIIKRTPGKITNENIIKTIEKTKNYNFKGLTLNFDPTKRRLSNYIWIDKGKDEWKKFDINTKKSIKDIDIKKEKKKIINLQEKKSTSVRKKEIIFGTSLDLKGSLKGASKQTIVAINEVFKDTNNKNGINNKKLKIIAENDNYNPKISRENIEKLIKDEIDIILNPMGGPTTSAYTDLIKQGKILVLFPSTGSSTLRDPKLRYMIHFRPSYKDIHIAAVKYVKEKEGAKKIAFVYQDNSSAQQSVDIAIKKHNLKTEDYIKISYKRGQTNFSEEAQKIKEFDPDTIAFWTQSYVLFGIIKEITPTYLSEKILLTTEMLNAFKRLKNLGLSKNFINTENIPDPITSEIDIMKEYRKSIRVIGGILAETYISTNFLIEILKKIKAPITKEKIIKKWNPLKIITLKVFHSTLTPKQDNYLTEYGYTKMENRSKLLQPIIKPNYN